jgi:hypothetical protein
VVANRLEGTDADGGGFKFLGTGALPFCGEDDRKRCNLKGESSGVIKKFIGLLCSNGGDEDEQDLRQ